MKQIERMHSIDIEIELPHVINIITLIIYVNSVKRILKPIEIKKDMKKIIVLKEKIF